MLQTRQSRSYDTSDLLRDTSTVTNLVAHPLRERYGMLPNTISPTPPMLQSPFSFPFPFPFPLYLSFLIPTLKTSLNPT